MTLTTSNLPATQREAILLEMLEEERRRNGTLPADAEEQPSPPPQRREEDTLEGFIKAHGGSAIMSKGRMWLPDGAYVQSWYGSYLMHAPPEDRTQRLFNEIHFRKAWGSVLRNDATTLYNESVGATHNHQPVRFVWRNDTHPKRYGQPPLQPDSEYIDARALQRRIKAMARQHRHALTILGKIVEEVAYGRPDSHLPVAYSQAAAEIDGCLAVPDIR